MGQLASLLADRVIAENLNYSDIPDAFKELVANILTEKNYSNLIIE